MPSICWPNQMAVSADQTPLGSKRKRSPSSAAASCAVAFELVLRREHAPLQLVRGEAVLCLQRARLADELLGRSHLARAVPIRIAEEQVRGERDAVLQAAAQDLGDRHAPLLAEDVQAGELERGQDLRAVVVERGRRVGDQEPHLLEPRRVVADEIALQRAEHRLGRFPAAAHLAQADQALVGLDLDDRPHEPPPVAAVGMPQRRLQRHRHARRPDVGDLHGSLSECPSNRDCPAGAGSSTCILPASSPGASTPSGSGRCEKVWK